MNKGLEALKTIRYIHDMECGKDNSIDKDFDTVEKELKAFDIIKTRCAPLLKQYMLDQLTKEEYELVKGVLL